MRLYVIYSACERECVRVRACLFIVPFPWDSVFSMLSRVNACCSISTWNTFFFSKKHDSWMCIRRSCIILRSNSLFLYFFNFHWNFKTMHLHEMSQNCQEKTRKRNWKIYFHRFSVPSKDVGSNIKRLTWAHTTVDKINIEFSTTTKQYVEIDWLNCQNFFPSNIFWISSISFFVNTSIPESKYDFQYCCEYLEYVDYFQRLLVGAIAFIFYYFCLIRQSGNFSSYSADTKSVYNESWDDELKQLKKSLGSYRSLKRKKVK